MNRRAFLLTIPLIMSSMIILHAASAPDLLGVPVRDIDGKETTLGAFSGKVLLVVNVASECGYTNQYEGLETLYKKYKERGLVILGFPSNDFGAQEPGDNQQIKQFCTSKFHVTFPMFSKITILGSDAHPLFVGLTGPASPLPGPVKWNFNKFLIGRDGLQTARFQSDTEPDSEELKAAIEKALSAAK